MKNIYLLLLAFCCVCFNSCDNESYSIDINENESSPNTYLIKALSIDEVSVSNPKLHSDWENVSIIYLNGGGEVDAPWVYKEGNSMNIPLSYRTDIKKEDSWIMLSHTLIKQESPEPNYILLYNKNRGIVKGFYYSKQPIKNQSFMWVMEAAQPTSLFPSNTSIQTPINNKYQYITSSNIVEQSQFDFGHLNQGWNAFSFELIYGSVDNAPVISIKGYNDEKSIVNMKGDYSGEVIIPITKDDPSGLNSFVSKLKNIVGGVSSVVPQLKTIEEVLSVSSTILGNTSLSKSKTSVTNIRATSSGKINLQGTSFTDLGGTVSTINNINLKRISNNIDLGLWTLIKKPEFSYDRTQEVSVAPDGTYSASIYLKPTEKLENLIIVNPQVLSQIKSYKVKSISFFTNSTNLLYQFKKLADNCYTVDYSFTGNSPYFENNPLLNMYYAYVLKHTIVTNPFINIMVEFTYNDGSSFISCRNFEVGRLNIIENTDVIDNIRKRGDRVVNVMI